MLSAIARFALKDEHGKYDSAILVILTHGEHGQVFGVDDHALSIERITCMLSPRQAPLLRDKPKLIFLQACRGGTILYAFRD